MVAGTTSSITKVFVAYYKNRSPQLRNRLVEMNLNLARRVTHSIAKRSNEPYEDLEQVAFLGLIAAVEGFDPTTGYAFSSYAVPRIEGKIKQYIRDRGTTIRIPQNLQTIYIKKAKVERKFQEELGRFPTSSEVIKALGISQRDYSRAIEAHASKNIRSLNSKVGEDSSDLALEEVIANPSDVGDRISYQVPSCPNVDASYLATLESAFVQRTKLSRENRASLRTAVKEYASIK